MKAFNISFEMDVRYAGAPHLPLNLGVRHESEKCMDWNEEQSHLTENLEILRELRKRFGEKAIEIASNARLAVHKKWMEKLSKSKSGRPSEIFKHSAFSVTSAEEGLLEYEVIEDSDQKFAVRITKCKYADFYIEKCEPEIGYAMHCALDFGEAEAYSSEIILKRTKTIMQGNSYCNHCYERKK
jgi:hypothetical protein